MSKIRFLMDIHVPLAITNGLRRRGIDVQTCQAAGLDGVADHEIVRFALENGWILFSQDRDFLQICSGSDAEFCGLVFSTQRLRSVSELIARLILLHEFYEMEELSGKIEFI